MSAAGAAFDPHQQAAEAEAGHRLPAPGATVADFLSSLPVTVPPLSMLGAVKKRPDEHQQQQQQQHPSLDQHLDVNFALIKVGGAVTLSCFGWPLIAPNYPNTTLYKIVSRLMIGGALQWVASHSLSLLWRGSPTNGSSRRKVSG